MSDPFRCVGSRAAAGLARYRPTSHPAKFTASLKELAAKSRWESALQLLVTMRDVRADPDAITLTVAIMACGRSAQWSHALALLGDLRMQRLCASVVTCSVAMAACERGRQWEVALVLMAEMRSRDDIAPDAVNFNVAVSACSRVSHWAQAWALLGEMIALRLAPDLFSLNSALVASSRARRWTQAALMLAEMQQRTGFVPDAISHSAVLQAHEHNHYWWMALSCLEAMRHDCIQINLSCYNIAVGACSRAGQWTRALSLLCGMVQVAVTPDIISYNSAMNARRQWKFCLALLTEILSARLWPDAISYGSAIAACKEASQWRRVVAMMCQALRGCVSLQTHVYNMVLAVCHEGERWADAIALFFKMRRDECGRGADIVSYNTAVSIAESSNEWRLAVDILFGLLTSRATEVSAHKRIALSESSPLAPVVADAFTFNAAISACGRGGQWPIALELLSRMLCYVVPPDATSYAAAISALGRSRKWQSALALFEESLKAEAPSGGFFGALGHLYNAAIAACFFGEQWRGTLSILARMRSSRVNFTSDVAASYFPVIISTSQAGKGQLASALYAEACAVGISLHAPVSQLALHLRY